jgi:hypothetical protein
MSTPPTEAADVDAARRGGRRGHRPSETAEMDTVRSGRLTSTPHSAVFDVDADPGGRPP